MDDFAQRLHDALVGRIPPSPDVAPLVRLAAEAAQLPLPEPTADALARMRQRFEESIRPRQGRTLLGWMGIGPHPAPRAYRLAAGLAAAAIAFSGGSWAAGSTPWDAAVAVGKFFGNAAQSLRPGASTGEGGARTPEHEKEALGTPVGTATPTDTPTPTHTPTPAPTATLPANDGVVPPTATPDPTPDDDEGADRDSGEDDEEDESHHADGEDDS